MRKPARWFSAIVAAVAWSALLLQYVLLIGSTRDTIGPWFATLQFFSFFTILSNLLVALTTTYALLEARSRVGTFFTSAAVRGGVALCIGVTGLIYFLVLSSTWAPTGMQWLVDKQLHYAVPVLYLAWWLACAEHRQLRWSDPLRWLLFPGVYLVWTLLRGAWLHEYPYPFVDVDAIGYAAMLRNSVGIGVLFALLGFGLVAIDRALPRRR
ncbi:MAG TPA: Pr6Pr family membrane protein [Dokdonella sp.]